MIIPLKPINKIIKMKYTDKIKSLNGEKLRLRRLLRTDYCNREIKLKSKIISRQLKKS